MLKSIHLLPLILLLLMSACSKKVALPSLPVQNPGFSPDTLDFPKGWLGVWTGDLVIHKGPQKMQEIPTRMTIAQINDTLFTWSTQFLTGDTSEVVKPYEFIVVDAQKGQYVLDEKNSLRLETYQIGTKLVSWYEVMGSLIQATYEMHNGAIVFEILAGSIEPVSKTGGAPFEGEDIPEVSTFPINVMQRAVLRKK